MDFTTLTTAGNISFYNSCEVTEVFLIRKSDNAIFNFFTIAVFEEKPYKEFDKKFLGNRIKVSKEYSVGIQRFWLTVDEIKTKFDALKTQNQWSSDGVHFSQFPSLKYLPKQYVPSSEGIRMNNILKNNYRNGSYLLEFFDEEKSNIGFMLKMETLEQLNTICAKIKNEVPIDLSIVRDRIGNFIFQFPITILGCNFKALSNWEGVHLNFSWHDSLSVSPDCLIQVESTFDKIYMGSVIEDYNKMDDQKIIIGNLDQINQIKIWRKEPSLILASFSGTYLRGFDFTMGIINPEPRLFELDGELQQLQITSNDKKTKKEKTNSYTTYINNHLYDEEKKQLEKSLSFKQYKQGKSDGIGDLQKLIQEKDKNGVYLWDPFLTSVDILKTLFYSKTAGVPLRAIGSINPTVKKVYQKKGMSTPDIMAEYKALLDNPKNNNLHLSLEFRIQHTNFGWEFHDRFLIFPSSEVKRPQVYSLGTSINSYGINHHILQEVSHPQPVVDAFNDLWEKLNNTNCLVWKHT